MTFRQLSSCTVVAASKAASNAIRASSASALLLVIAPPEISLVRNSAEVASILSLEKSGIEGGRLARRSFSSREAAARGARLVAKRLSRDVSTAYC